MAQMRRQSLVKFDAPLCETIVDTPLGPMRLWQKGKGAKVGFLAGVGGLIALIDHRLAG